MLYHKPIKVIVNNFWLASIVLLESRFSYNTDLPVLYSVHMYFTAHWRGYWHYYVTFPAANSHLISGQAEKFFFFVLRVFNRTYRLFSEYNALLQYSGNTLLLNKGCC
jgi:hypothetical protein